jgi:hypothetical protein
MGLKVFGEEIENEIAEASVRVEVTASHLNPGET